MIVYVRDENGSIVQSWDADEIELAGKGTFALITLGRYHLKIRMSDYPNGYILDVKRRHC